jgi:hypothetical protein
MSARRLTTCDQHEINNLDYLTFHEDAEIRTARGERQVQVRRMRALPVAASSW